MKPTIVSMITAAGLMAADGALAVDMPPLATKNQCADCHAVEKKKVGPAWRDVSRAYNKVGATGTAVDPAAYKATRKVADILKENDAKTAEEWLLHKVAKGGKGNWGTMPMPANSPAVSDADIKTLVEFVLGLEKN